MNSARSAVLARVPAWHFTEENSNQLSLSEVISGLVVRVQELKYTHARTYARMHARTYQQI